MRKITAKIAQAFENDKPCTSGNTAVKYSSSDNCLGIYLHGNRIAWKDKGKVYFTLCGWNTITTRERLKAAGISVYVRNYIPYCLGEEISDSSIYLIDNGKLLKV